MMSVHPVLFFAIIDFRAPSPPDGSDQRLYWDAVAQMQKETPLLVEVFGSRLARDRALPAFNDHVGFRAISARELEEIEPHTSILKWAVGHDVGEQYFEVAADFVFERLQAEGDHASVVIERVRYRHVGSGWKGTPLWLASHADHRARIARTESWLNRKRPHPRAQRP